MPHAAAALAETIATIETVFNPNKHELTSGRVRVRLPARCGSRRGTKRRRRRSAGRSFRACAASQRRVAWQLLDEPGPIVDPAVLERAVETFLVIPRFRKQYDEDVFGAPMSMMVETQRDPAGERKGSAEFYTIATLGSHSALQILKGAHDEGFRTLAIATRDTERLYRSFAFVDEVIVIDNTPISSNWCPNSRSARSSSFRTVRSSRIFRSTTTRRCASRISATKPCWIGKPAANCSASG